MTAHQPKPKLSIPEGQSLTLALQYSTGKQVRSTIPGAPDQMYYSLADGRGMYLPLEVGAQLDRLALKPGEPFTLEKHGPRDWRFAKLLKGGGSRQTAGTETDTAGPSRLNEPHGKSGTVGLGSPVNGAGEDAATILARCYQRGVEIALGAVDYAKTKGLTLAPTFEDIRCISAALMISETGGRR